MNNHIDRRSVINSDAENSFNARSKNTTARSVQRVPLGEKRVQLNRSNTNIKNTTRRILVPHAPSLSRANSSLGFSHKTEKEPEPKIEPVDYSKVAPLKRPLPEAPQSAPKRASPVKKDRERLPPSQNINETVTPDLICTREDIHYTNVDPVKRERVRLRECFDEPETLPEKKATKFVPADMDEIDVSFFGTGGSMRDGSLEKIASEEIEDDMGLSVAELNDLLD